MRRARTRRRPTPARAHRRRRVPGAPRHGRRPADRHDRRCRRLQLLSDEEPRRARRRRRDRDRRRRARGAHQAAAQRRADARGITTRSRAPTAGSTRCRPRSCARDCRFSRGWTERRRAIAGALSPRAGTGRGVRHPAANATPATSTTCFRCCARRGTRCRRSLRTAGDRDADSLPGADPAAAGARGDHAGRLSGRQPRLPAGPVAAALPRAGRCRCRRGHPRRQRSAT